ncbi:hypothetical protein GH5_07823 [Leishmania sp. Ghana 2012 LV757]|uniref:hypothetical protein n=1 Tax=Leishmania sp. Ghana 2012 LV757 TaxID=2803181 RepID=UPI001B57E52E|nr:hypothetical protein GH5_07823 [Leishmania sp. Ghana 2012 LV757]
MDAHRRGAPGRYPKPVWCGDSRVRSSTQGASPGREHNGRRSQQLQSSAARESHRPCEDERQARRGGRAVSSVSADVAASALREQCETTRLLARLLAGITLQWRQVMVDLAEAQVPHGVSDATAAVVGDAKPSGRTHTRHRHDRRRSRSPSQRRRSRLAHSAAAVSASYLTEELRFDVQAREAERARRSSRCRAPLASSRSRGAVHPYNCAGGASASTLKSCLGETNQEDGDASHTDARFCSAAVSWDRLTPAIQWVPLMLYGGAAVDRDTGTDSRRDWCERGVLSASLHPSKSCGHASEEDGETGDEGGCLGSGAPSDAQLRRTVLQGAARSAEVIILGMRQVREVLSAMALVNAVRGDDAHGNTRHRSHRGPHRSLEKCGRVSTRSGSASSDTGAEWARASTHRSRHHSQHTAQEKRKRQGCSVTAPLDEARHSSTDHSRHRLHDKERGESSPISVTCATPPSRSQLRSLHAADSPSVEGAASPAAAAGVLVYPAPPPSERVHIYSRAHKGDEGGGHSVADRGSATVAPGAAVSPLRYRRNLAAATVGSSAAPQSHVRRKLDWRATHAAPLAGSNLAAVPADEPAASAEALVSSINKSSTPASLARLAELHTVSSTARSQLPPACCSSSTAAAAALGTSEAYRSVLVHEEGEARMRIVMTHDCHLVSILRDHYERLRELERGGMQQSLASTIGVATICAPASVTVGSAAAGKDVLDVASLPSSPPSSSSLSAFAASAHAEVSSEADMSPSAQIPPTRSGGRDFDGEGVPDEAPPPTSTTAAAVAKLNKSVLSSPPQRRQPAWKKSSNTISRASASPSSAAGSATSRLPERRLPVRQLPSVVLDGSCLAGRLNALSAAAAAPTASAATSVSATPSPGQGSQMLSPSSDRPPDSAPHSPVAAVAKEEVLVEYAECTPPVTRQAHRRPSHVASGSLLSPLDESAKETGAQNAANDSDYTATAVSTDCISSFTTDGVIPERVKGCVSLGTTAIAAGPQATAGACASPTATFRGASPPAAAAAVGVDGTCLDELEDDVPPSPHSVRAAPSHSALDVELLPVSVANAKAACAPLPRKPPVFSPPPLSLVPDMNAVGSPTVNVAEVADAVSFSSVSSFHECSVESSIVREPVDEAFPPPEGSARRS